MSPLMEAQFIMHDKNENSHYEAVIVCVTKYVHSSTILKYKFKVLLLKCFHFLLLYISTTTS